MYYVSSESHIYIPGGTDILKMTVVIRNTSDCDFRIECPWQCLACKLKECGIKDAKVAGVDSVNYSYVRTLHTLSPVEANLARCLGKPKLSEREIAWWGRRCTWIGTWHFLDQYRVSTSLPRMLLTGLNEDMKVTSFPVEVSDDEVSVAVSNAYGMACSARYPILDYQALRAVVSKFNILKPELPQIQRADIEFGYAKKCPKGVDSCDLRF